MIPSDDFVAGFNTGIDAAIKKIATDPGVPVRVQEDLTFLKIQT